jgi:hypothetical protein
MRVVAVETHDKISNDRAASHSEGGPESSRPFDDNTREERSLLLRALHIDPDWPDPTSAHSRHVRWGTEGPLRGDDASIKSKQQMGALIDLGAFVRKVVCYAGHKARQLRRNGATSPIHRMVAKGKTKSQKHRRRNGQGRSARSVQVDHPFAAKTICLLTREPHEPDIYPIVSARCPGRSTGHNRGIGQGLDLAGSPRD